MLLANCAAVLLFAVMFAVGAAVAFFAAGVVHVLALLGVLL